MRGDMRYIQYETIRGTIIIKNNLDKVRKLLIIFFPPHCFVVTLGLEESYAIQLKKLPFVIFRKVGFDKCLLHNKTSPGIHDNWRNRILHENMKENRVWREYETTYETRYEKTI